MSATSELRQAVNATATAPEPRKVGALLCFGIAIFPFVFSWFVLRKGYSVTARVVALGWLAVLVTIIATAQNPGSTTAPDPATVASTASAPAPQGTQTASAAPATPAPAPESNWSYNSDRDEMRGTTTRYARVQSDNELQFDFPYNGGSHGTLQLRDKAGDLNVILSIDKGQFTCSGIMNQTVAVKFDEGAIQRYACANASDGSSNVLFLMSERRFLKQLRSAHKVIIEVEFFQAGNQQLTFDVAGLKW